MKINNLVDLDLNEYYKRRQEESLFHAWVVVSCILLAGFIVGLAVLMGG